MKLVRSSFLMILIIIFSFSISNAGPYTDDLSKCLVESTTPQDRVALVQWIFSAASKHPAVKDISSVSEEQLDTMNKTIAELVMRLLTASCEEKTRKALKYEGSGTIQSAFTVLGQVAGRELFSSPEVSKSISGLQKYIDKKKLEKLKSP